MCGLTPAGGQRETDADKAEAHNHVPGANIGYWVLGLGNVEDHDPEESDKESANHCWGEPAGAFQLHRSCLSNNGDWAVIFLLLTDARLRHGGRLHERMGRWASGFSSSITMTLLSSTLFNIYSNSALNARWCEMTRSPLRLQILMMEF